ncbi:MAG: hypothetical protein PUB03_05065 [bacterium]|nr:hypothetical protein [bacterium]
MKLKNYIYFVPVIISLLGILAIILAVKNKDRKRNKYIIIGSIINILYLFIIGSNFIGYYFSIITDLGFLLVEIISFIGGILYLIAIIICIAKKKKVEDINKNKNILILFLIIIFLPIILFIMCLTREIYLIKNSSIIVFYNASSLGETDFAYAISDKYFEEISTEMDLIEYAKIPVVPKNIIETNESTLTKNGITIKKKTSCERYVENSKIHGCFGSTDYIYVYKNSKLMNKKKIPSKYSVASFPANIYYNEENKK